jgi:hypothetical protein
MTVEPLEPEPPLTPAAAFALEVTAAQWRPLALVLLLAASGLGLLLVSFRLGALTVALSAAVAFTMRALLTDDAAGILAVRAKYLDLLFLGVVTVAIAVLAVWVPII